LVDYVSGLQDSLGRAEEFVRTGELGQAVWAYLEVLEVDPDNTAARRQVGQVATAVRQFDRTAPGRRWMQGLPPLINRKPRIPKLSVVLKRALIAAAILTAFGLGYLFGVGLPADTTPPTATDPTNKPPPKIDLPPHKDNSLMGKGV
jgi:hypothetical protein